MSLDHLNEGISARADRVNKSIEDRAHLDGEVRKSTKAKLTALKEEYEGQLPVLEHPPVSAIGFAEKYLQETGYEDADKQARERIVDGMGAASIAHFDALTLREAPPTNDQMQAA